MARNFKSEYRNFHSRPAEKKKRAMRNKARRRLISTGRVRKGDGRDVHHRDGNPRNNNSANLRVTSKRANRSFPRTKTARKRRR